MPGRRTFFSIVVPVALLAARFASAGMTAQGMTAQGMTAQGMTAQGMTAQGMTAQGMTAQGMTAQGVAAQGMTAQGMTAQGLALMGTDLLPADIPGASISHVDIHGTTLGSPKLTHRLTTVPGAPPGPGNYISLPGRASAVGHYAVAHLLDVAGQPTPDRLDLFIAAEQRDTAPNQFHRPDEQDNQAQLYVIYMLHRWSGEWMSLCPYNPATESASAMAIPEDATDANKFTFACTATGVMSKCARNWGYRPWAKATAWTWNGTAWGEQPLALDGLYGACKHAAMAAYVQNETSYTKNGTMVDLFDTRQIVWPNALQNPWSAGNPDSLWMLAREYLVSTERMPTDPKMLVSGLQRTRYRELSPAGESSRFAYVSRLERDRLEDALFEDPAAKPARIDVHSPIACTHNERTPGLALPWDCSPCTTKVCASMPQCCTSAPASAGWTSFCVDEAKNVCKDRTVDWPLGRVWPTDASDEHPAPSKYLLGPSGAVLRVAGGDKTTPAVTLEGWACDPEWPGAVVSVQVWDRPRDKPGSHQLAEVRAESPLVAHLAKEVSLACDGPRRDYARHGFAYTLPAGKKGSVYVYAIDERTDDGPAAPPALIRNGVVPIPTAVSALARPRAVVATGWIEAPAGGTFTFESLAEPGRLWVNGDKLFDWWNGTGGKQGGITLLAGTRYHVRWDSLQRQANPAGSKGLTWQAPGSSAQVSISPTLLYELAPGAGKGLRGTYYAQPNFGGSPVASRVDDVVDFGKNIVPRSGMTLPPGVGEPNYSVVWEGEVVPWFSEAYTFTVVGSGEATLTVKGEPLASVSTTPYAGSCAHDPCEIGPKLAATTGTVPACDPCVDDICSKDPYCCEGGYVSYYSSEPEWDAKCVAEVKTICKRTCDKPIPNPISPHRSTAAIPMRAGVHYPIRMAVSNTTYDDTIRLLWQSARQHKDVIPPAALHPAGETAQSRGAGMNVALFSTKPGKNGPEIDKALAAGATPALDLGLPATPIGTPEVAVLAPPEDLATAKPSPPSVVRPWFRHKLTDGSQQITVQGLGGLTGGSVRMVVRAAQPGDGGATGLPLDDKTVDIGGDGRFEQTLSSGGFGDRVVTLTQRTWAGTSCPAGAVCAESKPVDWYVTVAGEAAASSAPQIFTPLDPTASPTANVIFVRGRGTNKPVKVEDLGGPGATATADIVVGKDGNFSGTVTLSSGQSDANHGWHRLQFSQGGAPSRPVFVAVGIRPPIVTSPRHGAPIDCSPGAPDPRRQTITGRVPYPAFGTLRVAEENDRGELVLLKGDTTIAARPDGDGDYAFTANVSLGYGKHLLHVFQAPEPSPGTTTPDAQRFLRAFASLADTPTTRFVVEAPPPPIAVNAGASVVLTANGPVRKLHLEADGCSPPRAAPAGCAGCSCGAGPSPAPDPRGCALPFADVNLRIGSRLFTTRADEHGFWAIEADVFRGWNDAELSQVVEAGGGGGFSESCRSNPASVGVVGLASAPDLKVPRDIVVRATSPKGAELKYDVSAPAGTTLKCSPASGSTFPVGTTFVSCSAVDLRSGGVGLGRFAVTVSAGQAAP